MATHRTHEYDPAAEAEQSLAASFAALEGAATAAPSLDQPGELQSIPHTVAGIEGVVQMHKAVADAHTRAGDTLRLVLRFLIARQLVTDQKLAKMAARMDLMAGEISRIQSLPGNDPATAQRLGQVMQDLETKARALAAGVPTSTDEGTNES